MRLRSLKSRLLLAVTALVLGSGLIIAFLSTQQYSSVITPISSHHCRTCNRLRLTAAGALRPCLFGDAEIDVKSPFAARSLRG